MYKDLSIEQYDGLLSSKSATPGGGSALAMVAAKAVALIEMAINVTLTKPCDEIAENLLKKELSTLEKCRGRFYKLADEDSAAFDCIIDAMRLTKETLEQQKHRNSQLQKQYHKAALVPLEVMQLAELAISSRRCFDYLYAYVASDAYIGESLLKAVVENSLHNVTANTSLIKDDELKLRLEKQAQQIVNNVK